MEGNSPISYAARLSAMGGESRQSSFGAPRLTVKELQEDGGVLDKIFNMSKPSQVELYNPFKFVQSVDDEHFQFHNDAEDEESKKKYVKLCNSLSTEARGLKGDTGPQISWSEVRGLE